MKIIIAVIILLMSSTVHAGYQEGKVIDIVVRQSDGLHYSTLSGENVKRPECQTRNNQTYCGSSKTRIPSQENLSFQWF